MRKSTLFGLVVLVAVTGVLALVHSAGPTLAAEPKTATDNDKKKGATLEKPVLPTIMPKWEEGVVVSNPGVLDAVSRFYRMLQDDKLKADEIMAAPFLLDGRKELKETELQGFADKAREGSLKEERYNTIVGMFALPPLNTWEEAQRWLAPKASGDRVKALFDHAEKHEAWLVSVLVAYTGGDKYRYDHVLMAITNANSETDARVIGFMD